MKYIQKLQSLLELVNNAIHYVIEQKLVLVQQSMIVKDVTLLE